VLLENVRLHLSEDRSAVSQLASANSPINVCISKLRVARTASGTVYVEPVEGVSEAGCSFDAANEVEAARRQVSELSRENEELRRRLLASEKLHAEEKARLGGKIDELHGERMALEVSVRKMQLTQAARQADAAAAAASNANKSSQPSSVKR